MSVQFSNFGTTQLALAMLITDTATIVANGGVFPATGDFYLTCEDEIIKVTARSGNNMTLVRAQFGTAAAAHANNTDIKLNLPREVLENFYAERILVGGYASRPATGREAQEYWANDIDLAWRYTASAWDLIHPVYVPAANKVDLTGWTSFNLGTSTWTDFNGVLHVTMPQAGSDTVRGYSKNLPSAPYNLYTIVRPLTSIQQYNMCGIGLYDGTKFRVIYLFGDGGDEDTGCERFNSVTSFSGSDVRHASHAPGPVWFRIQDDNTNWNWFRSHDGKNWNQVYSVARNNFLTATKVVLMSNRTDTTWPVNLDYQFLAYWEA